MNRRIGYATLLVRDYDEAIRFFVEKLAFDLVEDTLLSDEKRWVLVAPTGEGSTCLLLARASTSKQLERVGDQTGGRVFMFLHTDNFVRDHKAMLEHGIVFREEPRHEPYGTVAVFEDSNGNLWDLLHPSS